MADITMCLNQLCPNAGGCYRITAPANPYQQSVAMFEYTMSGKGVECDHYWPNAETIVSSHTRTHNKSMVERIEALEKGIEKIQLRRRVMSDLPMFEDADIERLQKELEEAKQEAIDQALRADELQNHLQDYKELLAESLEKEVKLELGRDELAAYVEKMRETMLAAIKSGDWKVDGACDPDALLYPHHSLIDHNRKIEAQVVERCATEADNWDTCAGEAIRAMVKEESYQ